jgi:hypothetical protein
VPRSSLILVCAGPPCQGVSGLNSERQGALLDPRSSLFLHVPRVLNLVKRVFSWATTHLLMENVASMSLTDMTTMSEELDLFPMQLCASHFTHCRRDRLYWFDWKLHHHPDVSVVWNSNKHVISVSAQPICLSNYLNAGDIKDSPDPFPTFTRPIVRKVPGPSPAGLNSCDPQTLERWKVDLHRYPPYTYLPKHLVSSGKSVRQPNVQEKERLLGFDTDFTAPCLPRSKQQGSEWLDVRGSLLGNTWAIQPVAFLLNHLLYQFHIQQLMSPQDIINLCSPSVRSKPRPSQKVPPRFSLVQLLILNTSFKGADIKLTNRDADPPSTFPRKPIPSKWFKWTTTGSWKFENKLGKEHINVLELRAFLHALKARLRLSSGLRTRFLHLLDSQVCLGVLAKGRSCSRKLSPVIRRTAALLLASGSTPFCGWVRTHDNPADRPSRKVIKFKRCRKRK